MTRASRLPAGRPGYTLIELLVVIAIIAVLVGLLMSGVMAVLQARDRTGNSYDISKLDSSMQAALQGYATKGVAKSLPGRLVLFNSTILYKNPPVIPAGRSYNQQDLKNTADALRIMFGRRIFTKATIAWDGNYVGKPPVGRPTSLGANSVPDPGARPIILEGQHCLAFYLGGIASVSGGLVKMNGFSADETNPIPSPPGLTPTTSQTIGPFYQFETNRMQPFVANGGSATPKLPFYFAYRDRYGTPFAYFGGAGASNTYVTNLACKPFGTCPSLPCPNQNLLTNPPVVFSPYFVQATGTFANPNSYQIISAGRDKAFGVGGNTWNPNGGVSDGYGRDDQSNFTSVLLAGGQK